MNIVLMVMDSLRLSSIRTDKPDRAATPFMDSFKREALYFSSAISTECWTLPSHLSMFTGLMPSEHGAHFAHMAYTQKTPTLAEILSDEGFHTEIITRNSVFDGSVPGVNRGFNKNTLVQAEPKGFSPGAWLLALSKGRIHRQLSSTGFISAAQRENLAFAKTFVKSMFPADRLACDHALGQMKQLRQRGKPYFLFCNLYDVHAPYPPLDDAIFLPATTPGNMIENVRTLGALAKISQHAYLAEGFSIGDATRSALLNRYHQAIARMDQKVGAFYSAAKEAGLWEDTLFILTSDHGEAFGEHKVYLHDAGLHDENISVPLWIRCPDGHSGVINDVVSTRELFHVMRHAAGLEKRENTILDTDYRQRNPTAYAEHFYYPRARNIAPYYAQNVRAEVNKKYKLIARGEETKLYDRETDIAEQRPMEATPNDVRHAMAVACG